MIVKQGLAAYGEGEVGLGELNAAFAGLGTLCGMVGPLLWGTVYNIFLRAAADSSAERAIFVFLPCVMWHYQSQLVAFTSG